MNWDFGEKISNIVGKINQTLNRFHAQVATPSRRALIQHYESVCHVSDINAAHVQVHVHPLAWVVCIIRTVLVFVVCLSDADLVA